jgi:polar amino acid transport system substrate-binding protein
MKFINNLFIVIMIITGSVVVYKAEAKEVWVITSLNWQPYSGAEIMNQGNSIQKLRSILKKEKIELLVEFHPWKRSQAKAKSKEYIGYFPAWPEEVYEGFIASRVIDWSDIAVMKQSNNSVVFKDIDELFQKYKVGVVRTYTYPKAIEDAMKKYPHNVDSTMSEVSLLKKLSSGRHPVAITDPNVMKYLAEKEGIANIELVKHITKKELVLALRDDADNKPRIALLKKLLTTVK